MELFLSGVDPQIPYFLERGPYVPTQTVHVVPAANGQPGVPARELEKPVTDLNYEDRRLVSIDTKARSLISMSLLDDVFHFVCHLRTAKEIWNTVCVQYEGTAVLKESRKIFLVHQYESFIHQKGETLSQTHQRFNFLLIDLKTIGTSYSNSEVITKFMESLPEYWETYTTCLTMSKDIKTLTLSELYGIVLNHEQQKKLKKNLIRDTKETKSNSLALVSDSVPTESVPSSSITLTELESYVSKKISDIDSDFNESLAFLTPTFKKFARKGNFPRRKPLALTEKPKSTLVEKVTATCYNCPGKGHFANDCRYKKNQFTPTSTTSSSKTPKYLKLKEKYKKMKSLRKGKGLIVEDCDWDDVSSDESSDKEDTQFIQLKYHDGTPITDHLNTCQEIINQLSGMGIKFEDEIQGLWILGTLPDSWETFRTSLSNYAPDGVISMELAKGSILNEEMRRKSQSSSSQLDVLVTESWGRSQRRGPSVTPR
ncbi:hypothetical protein OSB04_016633 [Centaurea solstitialis]|uniref:CCHC-type domain-containing protein n=1 Tax=Centaurea solstitialis TaxID=347529 RepID=A0AA38T907_9ASTR|nr:hypothetical protein OSB04_016633 [Centaurea solstitialis]